MARPKVDPVVIDFANIAGGGGLVESQLIRPRQTFSRVFFGPQVAGNPLAVTLNRDCWLTYCYADSAIAGCRVMRVPTAALVTAWTTSGAIIAMLSGAGNAWIGNESVLSGDKIWVDSSGGLGAANFVVCVFSFGPVQTGD